jgi:hypothetical protein
MWTVQTAKSVSSKALSVVTTSDWSDQGSEGWTPWLVILSFQNIMGRDYNTYTIVHFKSKSFMTSQCLSTAENLSLSLRKSHSFGRCHGQHSESSSEKQSCGLCGGASGSTSSWSFVAWVVLGACEPTTQTTHTINVQSSWTTSAHSRNMHVSSIWKLVGHWYDQIVFVSSKQSDTCQSWNIIENNHIARIPSIYHASQALQ